MEPDDFAKTERVALDGVDASYPLSMNITIRGGLAPEDIGEDEPPAQPNGCSSTKDMSKTAATDCAG